MQVTRPLMVVILAAPPVRRPAIHWVQDEPDFGQLGDDYYSPHPKPPRWPRHMRTWLRPVPQGPPVEVMRVEVDSLTAGTGWVYAPRSFTWVGCQVWDSGDPPQLLFESDVTSRCVESGGSVGVKWS